MSSFPLLLILALFGVSLTAVSLSAFPLGSFGASTHEPGRILPMRERAKVIDSLLQKRLDRLVPELMREHGIDLWVLVGREYDEDPVLHTMLPATWINARRRTILVFHDPGEGKDVERLAVARYRVGDAFEAAWNPEEQPGQWERLAEIIGERNPKKIGLNLSSSFAHADGLSHTQHEELMAALPDELQNRVVSAEALAVGWLERRIPEELEVYASVCRIAREIMKEALSERVIQPGVTTTDDVKWWCRDRIRELGLVAWFHPLVSVQRPDEGKSLLELMSDEPKVIHRGDLVHLDLGITYLRLNTDTQQMAYVLKRGETQPPEGLRKAYARGVEAEDILTSSFAPGRTGNEILKAALTEAKKRGIGAMIYSHPLGYHGHAAGAPVGMWDKQGGVPGAGDRTVADRSCYSIELSILEPVPEWGGQKVRILLEEDAVFEDGRVTYLDGRQTELYLVR